MKRLSRRQWFERAAAAAALPAIAAAQAPQPPANVQGAQAGQGAAPAGRGGGRGRGPTQGGNGRIQVLLVTKGHGFDRGPFFAMFDALGTDITWTHVEHPAAQVFFDPERAKPYDVLMYYDAPGRVNGPNGFENPPQKVKDGFKALLQSGKGMVFFHHSIAAWSHTWPEYSETIGGACDWSNPLTQRGKDYPNSGAQGNVAQVVTVLDKAHPITQGLGDSFEITDETYLCPYFEDSVHPLLRTNFKAIDSNFPNRYAGGWRHPEGSSLAAWVKAAERSPIAYVQFGHNEVAWTNPAFLKLMGNAIKWAASPEAKAWAAANSKKIFK